MLNSLRFFAFLLCILVTAQQTCAEGNKDEEKELYRVIFSTFEDRSAGKYQYLTDSVQAMLASRLAAGEKIVVLDKSLSKKQLEFLKKDNKEKALVVGQELQVDYLISGALYELNSGLNIQLTVYPLARDGEMLRFSTVTDADTSLIADVEVLSKKIARDAFGQDVGGVENKKTDQLAGNSGFITEHPEAAYKKKLYAGAFASVEGRGIKVSAQGAQRSIEVPIEMITMTVGDLDLDGEEEVLIMSRNQLQLYDITEKGLELIGQATLPRGKRNHAINIADINGDNVKEIYVSATHGLDVSSMIWTWDKGNGFTLVADRIPWYLRPVDKPGDGWVLMGQKRGLEKIDFMQPGIYVLEMATDYKIIDQKKIALPPKVNLFDFVFADLNGDGSFETITIDHLEKMKVYNSIHELLWVSKRSFGGSNIYLGPSQGEAADDVDRWGLTVDEEALREPIFVPNTVLVKDFDEDGSQEIIVNENKSNYLDIFYKLRMYDSSLVVGLHWNGEGMDEVWRTGKYNGLIAAYNFASTNNEKEANSLIEQGKNPTGRLFIGHVPAKGTLRDMLPGGLESELKVYDLEFIEEAVPQ